MKRKCDIEKTNWTTVYTYSCWRDTKPCTVELTLPFETMTAICDKWCIYPELGAGEASYPAFRDWLYRHRRTRKLFYGHGTGFDIQSLVTLFHEDLQNTAKLEEEGEAK